MWIKKVKIEGENLQHIAWRYLVAMNYLRSPPHQTVAKRKLRSIVYLNLRDFPTLKEKKKSERSRSACSTETDCISVYQSWIQIQ